MRKTFQINCRVFSSLRKTKHKIVNENKYLSLRQIINANATWSSNLIWFGFIRQHVCGQQWNVSNFLCVDFLKSWWPIAILLIQRKNANNFRHFTNGMRNEKWNYTHTRFILLHFTFCCTSLLFSSSIRIQ